MALPERVVMLCHALRHADPDEAGPIAVDLIEGAQRLVHAPPSWTRVAQKWGPLRAKTATRWSPERAASAARAIAGRWTDLDQSVRRLAAAAFADVWLDALAEVEHGLHPHEIAGVIAAACDGPICPDPGVIASHLDHVHPDVISAAATALGRMVGATVAGHAGGPDRAGAIDEVTGGLGPTSFEPDRAELASALTRAIRGVEEHRRREVLAAAVLFAVDGTHDPKADRALASSWFGMARDGSGPEPVPGTRELAAAFRRSRLPGARAAAWRWLDGTGADGVMLERLGFAARTEDHADWLNAAHLVLRPERAARAAAVLASSGVASGALPDARALSAMSERQRLAAVRLIGELRAPDSVRGPRARAILGDPSPAVRLGAQRLALPADVSEWCFDAHPAVARSASLRWASAGALVSAGAVGDPDRQPANGERRRIAGLLARSPHAVVRRIGRAADGALCPWGSAETSSVGPASAIVLRRWHAANADDAIAALRERITGGPVAARVRAIRLADRAGLASAVERELVASAALTSVKLAQGERVAATAVRALRRVRTDASVGAVRAALDTGDTRVRANAVEALAASRDASVYPMMIELKDDGAHRARANALRALLTQPMPTANERLFEPEGVESLERMLTDDRAEHRLAAVWLAERTLCGSGASRLGTSFEPLARRVAGIAREDADSTVRARGVRCASRLLSEIRSGGQGHGEAARAGSAVVAALGAGDRMGVPA
ncbi:MAG: HEAT repeat domain-containing protein [Planctomycetota bacterium]